MLSLDFFLPLFVPIEEGWRDCQSQVKERGEVLWPQLSFFIDLTARCPPSTLCFPALNYDSRPLVPLEAAW